ncbi:polyketide synthase dehydratase domain-containing protein, partial [Amycolatopsis sp. SID8362]|uniref:polyketide synthase dehydratase domain-containing protein n=1 Tax=Amycolatopsis sp. SID8362 TaxID=2690346 RepID=UPI00142AC7A6
LGLDAAGHPLLAAATRLADPDVRLFTGRLSLAAMPWLADHAVLDTPLLPGTAFLDLALHAARETGAAVAELTVEAPLVLPRHGAVLVQVTVGEDAVKIFARTEDGPWTRHASGTLAPAADVRPPLAWPPAGTEIDVEKFYVAAAEDGFDYGPAFQGLARAWRSGDDVYAEISPAEPGAFVVHPALLDAAAQAVRLGDFFADDAPRLPFAWSGVTAHTAGARALRARLSSAGPDAVSLVVDDEDGRPVLTAEALTLRPFSPAQLAAGSDSLYRLAWQPIEVGAPAEGDVVVSVEPGDVREVLVRHLDLVREWLDRAEDGRLVVLTRGATEDDLAGAALWGLLRSAQAEHPGRIVLADVDDDPRSLDVLPAALGTGEGQLALRAGTAYVPAFARA